ncbi:hypothetical protein [Clostridium botulinum]|nr:hypothetical protein [Clostridium botulinum]
MQKWRGYKINRYRVEFRVNNKDYFREVCNTTYKLTRKGDFLEVYHNA